MVDDAVVLHLAFAADTQCVIPRIVGALPHQEEACLRRVEEPLCLLPGYLPMKPAMWMEEMKNMTGENLGEKVFVVPLSKLFNLSIHP